MKKSITEETRMKMRLARLGKPRPDMIGNRFASHPVREDVKKRISDTLKGRVPANIELIKGFNKGKKVPNNSGEKHAQWKGDAVGKTALHDWIKRHYGFPNTCEHCGMQSDNHHIIHWANKSQKYIRDRSDWLRLCASCHKKYDLHYAMAKDT